MESVILKSKRWLFTSPHRDLYPYELEQIQQWRDQIGQENTNVYDLCLGTEGAGEYDVFGNSKLHYHLFVRFTREYAFSGTETSPLPGWDMAPVSEMDEATVVDYCAKCGNYWWVRESIPEPYNDPDPVWRPWQQRVIDALNVPRQIICVVDERGNTGKTFLAMWHRWHHRGEILPLMRNYQDIMRATYQLVENRDSLPVLFIDLPRAQTKKTLQHMFAAIETIKNGICYDDRYQLRQRLFAPPKVVVFTNEFPDMNLLSVDRWLFIDTCQTSILCDRVGQS